MVTPVDHTLCPIGANNPREPFLMGVNLDRAISALAYQSVKRSRGGLGVPIYLNFTKARVGTVVASCPSGKGSLREAFCSYTSSLEAIAAPLQTYYILATPIRGGISSKKTSKRTSEKTSQGGVSGRLFLLY